MASSEVPYINYGGNIVLEAPYQMIDCLMYGFLFKSQGGKEQLQAILDQRLNFASQQSNLYYEAVMPQTMLTYSYTPRSLSVPQQNLGYTIENELCTWILSLEKIKVLGNWVDNRLVWFIPYIMLDNIFAVVAGRETYGYPKILGENKIPTDPYQATYWASSVSAFQTYSPNSCLQNYPFIEIQKQEKYLYSCFDSLKYFVIAMQEQFSEKIGEHSLSTRICIKEIFNILNRRIDCVFLKQFRSPTHSQMACYQAIIGGAFQVTDFKGAGFMGFDNYSISINDLASYPLGKELGIVSGQKSELAFYLKTDFNVPLGKELYKHTN